MATAPSNSKTRLPQASPGSTRSCGRKEEISDLVQRQRSFVTSRRREFPLLLWRRGLGRGGHMYRNFFVKVLGYAVADAERIAFGVPASAGKARAGISQS